MPDRLLFVTSNPGKVREVETILGRPVERIDLDLPEIQALDVEVVARHKAETAFARLGRPVMVEDTGLYIAALHGLPGAFIRWFLGTIGRNGLCALIPATADRTAHAKTAIAVADASGIQIFSGDTVGIIALAPAGDSGFGWDPIFRPDGATLTFAEMTQVEKNHYSMRRRALDHLRTRLESPLARLD